MAYTKNETRSLVRQLIDDPNASRWSDANLDVLISTVIDDLWADLLHFAPWLTSDFQNLTSLTSPGFVDLRLTGSGGDLDERFFRVQTITRQSRQYYRADQRDVVIEDDAEVVARDYTYTFFGDQLHLFPYDTSEDVEIRYSYLPTSFDDLGNSSTVEWPEGFERAHIFESAAMAMQKGATEEASALLQTARDSLGKLKSAISRNQIGPITPWTGDSPISWGSVG